MCIHTSKSDNVGDRFTDLRRSDALRDSGYSDRTHVDREYSDYAYIWASAINRPPVYLDQRTRDGGTMTYGHVDRSRDVGGHTNRQMDANLYHIASNRTISYAGSDEMQATLPVSAAAATLRFLDPSPYWLSRHGSLDGGQRRQNGEAVGNTNKLSTGNLTYTDGETATTRAERSYSTVPRQLGLPSVHYETPPHVHAAADISGNSIELSPAGDPPTFVLHGQNYIEVSKPFEMADVYKYSSRMRHTAAGDRNADMRSTSSPHLTTFSRDTQLNRDQRPAYSAANPQYLPLRSYQKPVFD